MKFEPDRSEGVNIVTHHDGLSIRVGPASFTHSILLPWAGEVRAWPPRAFAELSAAHFELALALRPELVIFGSGRRLRFVPPALLRSLIEQRIGVESMDTAAACRTYNVLAAEGRRVLGAMLLESTPAA